MVSSINTAAWWSHFDFAKFLYLQHCSKMTIIILTTFPCYWKKVGYICSDGSRKQHTSNSVSVSVCNIFQNWNNFLLSSRGQFLLPLAYHLAILPDLRMKFYGLEHFCFGLSRFWSLFVEKHIYLQSILWLIFNNATLSNSSFNRCWLSCHMMPSFQHHYHHTCVSHRQRLLYKEKAFHHSPTNSWVKGFLYQVN